MVVLFQAGYYSLVLSLEPFIHAALHDSSDCVFFLAYAHSIITMQNAGVSPASLQRWLLIDTRLACFPEVARLYLRQARQALAVGDREACGSGQVDGA